MKTHESIKNMVVFAMLGTLMFVSKVAMEGLPNIHPLAMYIVAFTLVYRVKALIPIYVYVFLNGAYAGFSMWWYPYLYLWAVLWVMAMLIPRKLPDKVLMVICPVVCALHGILFGTLYAPAQALMFNFSFATTIKWIIAGLPWDAVHAVGNFVMGLMALPLAKLLKKLNKYGA